MAKIKTAATPIYNTKVKPADIRVIETSLINKEAVFQMLALAEAIQLPVLLVGDPGVAKTKAVLDYAKAWNKGHTAAGESFNKNFMDKIFILETDEGTKSSEIKGMPNLERLFTDNKYELDTPAADAEVVVVNEIDKASSNIRNSMLGIMNERFLFNGKYKKPCAWKLFVGTCNVIPKDEIKSPFWDRFMLKMDVSRVTQGELVTYFKQGARNYKEVITIGVPTKAELETIIINPKKLEKFLNVCYKQLSDRTLTFVPLMTKAVSVIWNVSIDEALVKVCDIMVPGNTAASTLRDLLINQQMKSLLSKIELLGTYKTKDDVNSAIQDIEVYVNTYHTEGHLDADNIEELGNLIADAIEKHPTTVPDLQAV